MKEALIVQEICRGALDVKKVYKVRRINGSGKKAHGRAGECQNN